MSDSKQVEEKKARPIWVDMKGEIQKDMTYRNGDIIISVPAKSGTTWTMNIVHQLRSGGDPNVRDIYEQVHWLEFFEHPYQQPAELIKRWERDPTWYPRAFKTHSAIGQNNLEYDAKLKYIVVMRDPVDAVASLLPFFAKHNPAIIKMWKCEAMLQVPPSVDAMWGSPFTRQGDSSIEFLNSFWPHRHKENVLVLHFANMKKDHVGTIRKIAQFMNVDLPMSKFDAVCEYTSYKWMKAHGDKFAVQHLCEVPVLQPDGMVRNGAIGEGASAMTAECLAAWKAKMAEQLSPEQATWLTEGGPLP